MAETASLARPYVRAVFEIARHDGDLDAWSDQLALIAAVACDQAIRALDGHPRVGRDQLADLVIDVCGERLSEQGMNLVRLLTANRRLPVAGDIFAQYEVLKAEAENTVEVELESASEVDEHRRQLITAALETRTGRFVKLNCRTDPALLGGAVIRTGDWVYDGSIRARLQEMAASLKV